MSFILDTNVLSELRKGARADKNVRAWVEQQDDQALFLSVVALAEIRDGIEQLRARDSRQANQLEIWLLKIVSHFGNRILPVTAEVADRWGLLNMAQKLPDFDRLIAATAIAHGFDIATRNVRDFERTGIKVVNPWD